MKDFQIKKLPPSIRGSFCILLRLGSEAVGKPGQFALQIGSLVFVYNGFLRQFVDNGNDTWKFFFGFFLVFERPEFFHHCAHGLGIVTIGQSFLFIGADALDC